MPHRYLANLQKRNSDPQRGASLYLALLIIGILLAVILGLSTLSFLQLKMIREMGDSVSAFYAADTGIERELYDNNPVGTPPYEVVLDPIENRKYRIEILASEEGDCPQGVNYCVQAVGFFKETRRAIRITR